MTKHRVLQANVKHTRPPPLPLPYPMHIQTRTMCGGTPILKLEGNNWNHSTRGVLSFQNQRVTFHNLPPPCTEAWCVLVTGYKHTSAQQNPRQ